MDTPLRVVAETPEALFHFGAPQPAPAAPGAGAEAGTPARGAQPGEKILITGIAGGQGRLIARRLMGDFVLTGVDRHAWEGHPPEVSVHVVDLRKRKLEDIFRTERPDSVVHHALIRHFAVDPRVRHEVNVLGTKRLLEYCATYGVKRVVVLSSSYVYGALPDNSFYLDEDSPLNVSRTYPEVRDLAEVDQLATTFLWRHPDIQTSILRPVSTLGYYVSSAMGRYLGARWVPTMLGFDPMMQFIHEEDVAEAVALALQYGLHGVYNVVGPGAVPLSVAIRETGGVQVPLPEPIARPMFELAFELGLYHTPAGAIDFIKYPVTLDGRRFNRATGFAPLFSLEDIFASVRR
jgi:UDP-glucose 4-epimerase